MVVRDTAFSPILMPFHNKTRKSVAQTGSEPDSKQKTETDVTFYTVLSDFILVQAVSKKNPKTERGPLRDVTDCDRL